MLKTNLTNFATTALHMHTQSSAKVRKPRDPPFNALTQGKVHPYAFSQSIQNIFQKVQGLTKARLNVF